MSNGSEELVAGQRQTYVEYLEFVPMLFRQHLGREFIQFPSFDEAVDEYFCKVSVMLFEDPSLGENESMYWHVFPP